jgi:hypothetical protein
MNSETDQKAEHRFGPEYFPPEILHQPAGTRQEYLEHLCWLLRTSVPKIDLLYTMEQAFLPKNVRCEYNQRGPFKEYSPRLLRHSRNISCTQGSLL